MLSRVLRFAFAFALLSERGLGASNPSFSKRHQVRQYQENDKLGAVASESSVCSRIGVDLIKAGGNAADAVGSLPYECRFRRPPVCC